MEPNNSRSLDWKKRIKESLTPRLLNPSNSEEQNDSSHQKYNNCHNFVNPKFGRVGNLALIGDQEKSENLQNIITSTIIEKSAHIDGLLQSFIDSFGSESQAAKLNDSENSVETNECIANIIAADADELAKKFKKLEVKKNKRYSNLAESNRKAPNWNMSIKKAFDPDSVPENSLEIPEEVGEKESYLLYPEFLESVETYPWTFHKLSKDDCEPSKDLEEVVKHSLSEQSQKPRHYTNEEKKVLKVLRSARTFKPLKKSCLNYFDGTGVNCFKNSQIKSPIENQKPKNIPPPGGYVCIKPLTVEDVMKRPPNLIIDECWDYYEEW